MSVVVVRAPLRISLCGGGTDLPSFYNLHEGYVVAGAIDKYVYIAAHPSFEGTWRLKYSTYEEVRQANDIRHPILREALNEWEGPPLEIASVADVPAGTGLGSSGAFTVALLKALAEIRGISSPPEWLAEQACRIEIDKLGQPVGKQDQYAASFGGINVYSMNRTGKVSVRPLSISRETREKLDSRLLAFYTGRTRSASLLLADQQQRTQNGDQEMLDNLLHVKEAGIESASCLESGDLESYGELMHEHWTTKKSRSPGISNDQVDALYDAARRGGALGGKLVGAGGGGYLIVYTTSATETREAMRVMGVDEMPFTFQSEGCRAL